MSPDWITRERRVHPPIEEQVGLVEHQLLQMATQIDHTRQLEERNTEALVEIRQQAASIAAQVDNNWQRGERNSKELAEVRQKLDTVIAHVEEHRVATAELIEVFTFSKMLRRFVAWCAGGVLLFLAFFKDGSEVLDLFK